MTDPREITAEELEQSKHFGYIERALKLHANLMNQPVAIPVSQEHMRAALAERDAAAHTLRKREAYIDDLELQKEAYIKVVNKQQARIRELEGVVEAAYKQGCHDGLFLHVDDAWEQSKFRRWLEGGGE